jgi:hypothetical protein
MWTDWKEANFRTSKNALDLWQEQLEVVCLYLDTVL